jgi:repressor LexA
MRMRIGASRSECARGLADNAFLAYASDMSFTLAERIKQIRIMHGLDQTMFGEKLGASQSTVTRWEKGAQPKPDALRRIAELGGTTVDDLLGVPTGPIVEGYEVRWVPMIGLAPASSWREAIAMPMGEVPVRADRAGRNAFAVEVKGDSMDKILPEGGWAIVDPDRTGLYDNGVYLVSNGDHDVTLKRYKSNPARLEPVSHNPEHSLNVIGRIVAYGNNEGLH